MKPITEFHHSRRKPPKGKCKACVRLENREQHRRNDKRNNDTRMWVNGNYVPKSHPLWKPGRYHMDEAGAFTDAVREGETQSGKGWLYVCVNDYAPNVCKIGCTKDKAKRPDGYKGYFPFKAWDFTFFKSSDHYNHEQLMHRLLEQAGFTRLEGEWFEITPARARKLLRNINFEVPNDNA